MKGGTDLANWTHAEIASECRAEYSVYKRECDASYERYFAAHPELAGSLRLRARDLASALPAGHAELADLIPPAELHRHHLSANSSQILALALLGSAKLAEPGLRWLTGAMEPPLPPTEFGAATTSRLEYTLDPETLAEHPRQTAVDFFAESPDFVICLEAKWTEEGLGACSCHAPAPAVADCKGRILDREAYWRAAEESFGLPPREPGLPCPISAGYQAVRNVAAAKALAGRRAAAFCLLYDETNPFFRPTGLWPGWPTVLRETIADHGDGGVRFASVSWQALIEDLPVDDEVRRWAAEKHHLLA